MAASSSPSLSLPCSRTRTRTLRNPILSSFPSQCLLTPTGGASSLHLQRRNGGVRAPNVPPRSFSVLCMRHLKPAVVTENSWEKSILNSEIPVLVEFYASWCGPCRMVHRVIEELAVEYAGRLRCFMLNTDTDLPVAEDYEIKAVPVVLLFKNGEKRECVVGTMPKEFYVDAIEKVLTS